MSHISIAEAAEITGKSIQTIRRMIKSKKIKTKRMRTPQGFNYLIEKGFLMHRVQKLRLRQEASNQASTQATTRTTIREEEDTHVDSPEAQQPDISHDATFEPERSHRSVRSEIETFNTSMQRLMDQHEQDKRNFFALIKTFQDRVIILENEIKQLSAPKKSWWKVF